jgi:hypothetical protein
MRPLAKNALKVNWIGRRKKREWTACAAYIVPGRNDVIVVAGQTGTSRKLVIR